MHRIKFISSFLLMICLALCQPLLPSYLKDSLYIERSGRRLGPFYRYSNSNVFVTGNNQAAGFSQRETQDIIRESIAHAILQHKDRDYKVAVMINFKHHRQYSIDEYRIPPARDDKA
jgi:hypothetical protein